MDLFQKVINSFNYSCVVTFGGCREDFMMVVDDRKKLKNVESKSKRLFFIMTKPKVWFLWSKCYLSYRIIELRLSFGFFFPSWYAVLFSPSSMMLVTVPIQNCISQL